jgi:hypothetical protein
MIPQITIGAASLMGSLVVATFAVRWAVAPTAVRNRREYGAAAPQQLVNCPACRGVTSATVHGTLLRCTEGHQIGGES